MIEAQLRDACPWMVEARRLIGAKEVPGKVTAPFIATMLARLGAWWKDDETPWCATFVSWCLQEAQVVPPKAFYRAAAFRTWGQRIHLSRAAYGAVVIIPRVGGNHVGFLTGYDPASNRVQLLGGNQDNMVKFSSFPYWPDGATVWPTVAEGWGGFPSLRCPPYTAQVPLKASTVK